MLKLAWKNYSRFKYVTDNVKAVMEIDKTFSYFVKGYMFMPKYKAGIWDGKIRLNNVESNYYTFPLGLIDRFLAFLDYIKEPYEVSENIQTYLDSRVTEQTLPEVKTYSKKREIFIRDDQKRAVLRAIGMKRCTNICPTSFGKSLCIFYECLFHKNAGRKTLLVVPSVELVKQMRDDFTDYCTSENGVEPWLPKIQVLYAGKSNNLEPDTDVFITTWQSIYKLPAEFYEPFQAVILDECHKMTGECLRGIFEHCINVEYRTGWTGSLKNDGSIPAILVNSMIGDIERITTTKTLMDAGVVANLHIISCRFNYDQDTRQAMMTPIKTPEGGTDGKAMYARELKFIESCNARHKMIMQIISKMEGTGIIMLDKHKHADKLYKFARKFFPDRNVYIINGEKVICNDEKHRDYTELKDQIEAEEKAIIIASYGVFSTGVSIKNIHWLVFGSPFKSFVRTIQTIGRALRVSERKKSAILIDIVDDFSYKLKKKTKPNYLYNHFIERYKLYAEEKFKIDFANFEISA